MVCILHIDNKPEHWSIYHFRVIFLYLHWISHTFLKHPFIYFIIGIAWNFCKQANTIIKYYNFTNTYMCLSIWMHVCHFTLLQAVYHKSTFSKLIPWAKNIIQSYLNQSEFNFLSFFSLHIFSFHEKKNSWKGSLKTFFILCNYLYVGIETKIKAFRINSSLISIENFDRSTKFVAALATKRLKRYVYKIYIVYTYV